MKTIEIQHFFENFPLVPEQQLSLIEKYNEKYPASHFISFLYLMMLRERSPKVYEQKKSLLLLSIQNRSYFYSSKLEYFSTTIIEENEPNEIANLVAKFQETIPKIKFDPTKHNAEINLAEQAEIEDVEFISETLAMVYAEQGYTGKAVQMVKKLMLLYPEKNAYFAALIEKVKNSVTQTQNLEENNH